MTFYSSVLVMKLLTVVEGCKIITVKPKASLLLNVSLHLPTHLYTEVLCLVATVECSFCS